jgi:hypothetical protein
MTPRRLLYCLIGGLPLTIGALGGGHTGTWWLAGVVLAAAFVPVAVHGPRGAAAQFGVIAPALFVVSVLCIWTEAMVFVPASRKDAIGVLAGSSVMYLMFAAVAAALAATLKLTRPPDRTVHHRPVALTAALAVACALAYVAYYLIFGAVTYQYFTRDFYPDATEQVAQLGWWFWAMQFGRGLLMTLAVLPIVFTLRMARWQAALAVGAIMWVAGGVTPLLVPNEFMGGAQRAIHIVEIFTQNASLGATIVLLMRPPEYRRALRHGVASGPARVV